SWTKPFTLVSGHGCLGPPRGRQGKNGTLAMFFVDSAQVTLQNARIVQATGELASKGLNPLKCACIHCLWMLLDRAPYLSLNRSPGACMLQARGVRWPFPNVRSSFMRNLLSKLWADDGGFIISTEMLFICVILVIGIIGGLAALRAAVAT